MLLKGECHKAGSLTWAWKAGGIPQSLCDEKEESRFLIDGDAASFAPVKVSFFVIGLVERGDAF